MTQTEELIIFAKRFIGAPYKYGARMDEAPEVFDCSGFIKYVFMHAGIELPRSTIEQAAFAGRKVTGIKKIREGDLVFLRGTRGHYDKRFPQGIGHVVLYIGDGKVIHASSRRVSEYPNIRETGLVQVDNLQTIIRRGSPVVVIKRVLF